MNMQIDLVTNQQAAAFLGVSPRTTARWRVVGGGPPYFALGRRCIRYSLQDLQAFLADRLRRSTSERHHE